MNISETSQLKPVPPEILEAHGVTAAVAGQILCVDAETYTYTIDGHCEVSVVVYVHNNLLRP